VNNGKNRKMGRKNVENKRGKVLSVSKILA
jgi:hypothetical protein